MAPIMIDHATHPHIIDLILRDAPVCTLIAFRATSRAYRDRVSAALLAHVVLVRHPDRKENGFALPPRDPRGPGARLPYAPRFVRALEIMSATNGLMPAQPLIATLAPSVHTLVRMATMGAVRNSDPLSRPPADGGRCLDHVHTVVDYIYANWIMERFRDTLLLPPSTRRHVMHITWDTTRGSELACELSIPRNAVSGVREFVVVLWPKGMPDSEDGAAATAAYAPAILPERDRLNFGPSRLLSLFWWLNRGIGDAILAGATITVVGLERCPPCQIGGDEVTQTHLPSQDKGFALFMQAIDDEWTECGVAPERARRCMAKLQLLTLEEWQAGLGDRLQLLTLEEWQAGLGDRLQLEGEWSEAYPDWCQRCWMKKGPEGCERCNEQEKEKRLREAESAQKAG